MVRLLLLIAMFVLAPACVGATLAERSPVRPGLWWTPSLSGSGFELHVAPGQVFLIWYTYRNDGSPVWYTAQGAMGASGQLTAPLLEHAFADGRHAGYRTAGALSLQRTNSERITLDWQLEGATGTQVIEPYRTSGITPEIDHTGAWYRASLPGFGLTLGEQGPVLTAAYYAYDRAGRPTWLFGSANDASSRIPLARYAGACPACPYQSPRATGLATLDLALDSETALRATVSDPEALLGSGLTGAQDLVMLTTPSSRRPADRQLAAFASDERLRRYLVDGLATMTPDPGIAFSPPPPMVTSGTNLVESGVDEADLVKTDGRALYTYAADARGQRLATLRIVELNADGSGVTPRGTLDLVAPHEGDATPDVTRLYLADDTLVAITGSAPSYYFNVGQFAPTESWRDGHTRVELFGRDDPFHPVASARIDIDGHLIASRRIDDSLYLVTRYSPNPGFLPAADAATQQDQAQQLEQLPLADLLPKVSVDGGGSTVLVDADAAYLPPVASMAANPILTSVTRIDLAHPQQVRTLTILGSVETVSMSTTDLYLATSRYRGESDPILGTTWYGYTETDIHQVELAQGALRIGASGTVEGYIGRDTERAPFRLNAHEGVLRVVTSGDWGARGQNRVTLLGRSTSNPGTLKTLSVLPNAARPAPIGKPGEQLYATRFVGDRLYAVTYLNVDPLYVIDLGDPLDPRIAGEVELPGFSEYLHPLPNGLLLGVGLDAVVADTPGDDLRFAWYQGVKVALFDVSDASRPRVLQQQVIGKRGSNSTVLHEHHGFSVLAQSDQFLRFALPVRVHLPNGTEPPNPPADYHYPWARSALYTFELDITGPGSGAFRMNPPLVTDAPPNATVDHDDAANKARAVLTGSGAVYVEKGRIWYAPWAAPNAQAGPL